MPEALNFSDSEKKLRKVISNTSFDWNGEKFTTTQAYKPSKQGTHGECKTDCYVIATSESDAKQHEIKITYKKENSSFVENKIRNVRAETIFGDGWSEIIKNQINQIKEKFRDEPVFYVDDAIPPNRTKKGSIKLGWRYEMEIKGNRTLRTPIEQDIAKYVWENKNGNQEFRNCVVNGKKIKNSGIPNFVLKKNAEKFDDVNDILPCLIPIEDIIKQGGVTVAFTAQNFRPFLDDQGGGNKRHLSVPIDWSVKNGEANAELIFDKPLEFNSDIQEEKLKKVLDELDIPVGKKFDIDKFHKKLNPDVVVFSRP